MERGRNWGRGIWRKLLRRGNVLLKRGYWREESLERKGTGESAYWREDILETGSIEERKYWRKENWIKCILERGERVGYWKGQREISRGMF